MSFRSRRLIVLLLLGLFALAVVAQAKPRTQRKFLKAYPTTKKTRLEDCASCHVPKTTDLNPYGQALKDSTKKFAKVEGLDSDDDGVTNLMEIRLLTFPGDPEDTPDSVAVARAQAVADSIAAAEAAQNEAEDKNGD